MKLLYILLNFLLYIFHLPFIHCFITPFIKGYLDESNGARSAGIKLWDAPYHAIIYHHDLGTLTCGGVIVNPKWIITSAWCLCEFQPRNKIRHDIRVYIGVDTISVANFSKYELEPNAVFVKRALIHPSYDGLPHEFPKDNIGIIELLYPVIMEDLQVKSADYPDKSYSYINQQAQLTEFYGKGAYDSNMIMQISKATIVTPSFCRSIPNVKSNNIICARGDTLCRADNGAGLVAKFDEYFTLLGIVGSTQTPFDCVHDKPYTRITPYVKWINEQSS